MIMCFWRPNEQVAEEIRLIDDKLTEEELSARKSNCRLGKKSRPFVDSMVIARFSAKPNNFSPRSPS
jgi:hypothetical protein